MVKKKKVNTILTLEEVVKWIRNLSDGSYKKGKGKLVDEKGTHFCCLGVWADQHGCHWDSAMRPVLPGKSKTAPGQGLGDLTGEFKFGLDPVDQGKLIELNDSTDSWVGVINYIKTQILPKAV